MSDSHRPAGPASGSFLYEIPVQTAAGEESVPFEGAPCIVCGCRRHEPRFIVATTRFCVVQCASCGLGALNPRPTSAEIAKFYPPEYYGRGGAKFRSGIEAVVRIVGARHARFLTRQTHPGARLLDVGCGRGVAVSALARAGFEAHGFEVSHHAVEQIDPAVQLRVAPSLIDAAYPDEFFDEVVIWHVLEHLPDPREVLLETRRILKPGGVLVVAVPNFSSLQARWAGPAWFHLDLPRHLYHFPLPALKSLLEDCGFDCRGEHHFSLRQNPFGWVQSALNRLPGLPRNGLYTLLQQRFSGRERLFSTWLRLLLLAAFWLGMPFALLLSIVTAIIRSGATVHVVATKR